MPEHLVWTTVVHWRWPDGENNVLRVQSSVIEQSLMLSHSVVKRHVIIFHPATERMQKEERVLVSLFDQLLSCVLEKKAVTVVKWVSNLEGVNGISSSFLGNLFDLGRQKSVVVHSIAILDPLTESHFLA